MSPCHNVGTCSVSECALPSSLITRQTVRHIRRAQSPSATVAAFSVLEAPLAWPSSLIEFSMDTIAVFTAFLSNTTYVQRFLVLSRAYSLSLFLDKTYEYLIRRSVLRIITSITSTMIMPSKCNTDNLRLREVCDRSLSSYTAQCITLWRQKHRTRAKLNMKKAPNFYYASITYVCKRTKGHQVLWVEVNYAVASVIFIWRLHIAPRSGYLSQCRNMRVGRFTSQGVARMASLLLGQLILVESLTLGDPTPNRPISHPSNIPDDNRRYLSALIPRSRLP